MDQIDTLARKEAFADHANNLMVGMTVCFEEGLHMDMELAVGGNISNSRSCHRLILSGASRLLSAALQEHPMDEEISVIIPGVTESELDLLLQYIYTGAVGGSKESRDIVSLLHLLEIPVSFSLSELSGSDSEEMMDEKEEVEVKPSNDATRLQMVLPPSCPIPNPISSLCPTATLSSPAMPSNQIIKTTSEITLEAESFSEFHNSQFSCDHCGITFRREHNFRNHVKSVHPDEANIKTQKLTLLTLGGDQKLEAQISPEKVENPLNIEDCEEVDEEDMVIIEDTTKYQCGVCSEDCLNEEDLKNHFATKHESVIYHDHYKPSRKFKYRCTMCDRFFLTKMQLANHIKKGIHKLFKCKDCSKVLKTQEGLDQHVNAHKCAKNYKCGKCGEEFRWRSEFRRHAESVHGQIITESSICTLCNKSVVIKRMNEHIKHVHGNDKPFQCKVCQKRCTKASELKNHMRSHTGERPFSCDQCGATFSYSHILSRHKKFHAGARKFGCSICNKSFLQRSDLVKHSRVHSGEKPFKCEMCDRAFARVDYLKKHSLLHANPPKFTCSKCGETLNSAETLKRHIKNAHCTNHEETSCLKYLTATPQGDVEIANFEDFAFELPNIEIDGENRLVSDGVLEWNVGTGKEGMSELQAVSLDGGKTLMYVIQNDDGDDNVFNSSETNALLVNSTTTVVQGTAIIQGNAILQTDSSGGHHAIIQADPRAFIQGSVGHGHLVGEAVIEEEVMEDGDNVMDQGSVVLHTDAEGIKDLMVPEVFYV